MKKFALLLLLLYVITSPCNAQTVKIGTQVWSTKNLAVTQFQNGDAIQIVTSRAEWAKLAGLTDAKTQACADIDFNSANRNKFGLLYNSAAFNDDRGLVPFGFHIPTLEEFNTLGIYLGYESGKKMKSTTGWWNITSGGSKVCQNCASWSESYQKKVPCHVCRDTRWVKAAIVTKSGNGTISGGFSAFPAGYLLTDGQGNYPGAETIFWTSSKVDVHDSFERLVTIKLRYDTPKLLESSIFVAYLYYTSPGCSIRLIKD